MKRELEISSCNVINVGVETNTPMGGDTGHGGRTIFTLQDLAGTDIECVWEGETKRLEISLGGDTECDTFIDCLKFAYLELSRQKIKNEYVKISEFLLSPQSKGDEEHRRAQERRLEFLRAEFCNVVRSLQELEALNKQCDRWTIDLPEVE